jgi:proteasome accessory factor B
MSRLERLVNLTAALLHAERPVTAEQIRDRVPGYPDDRSSFRRQFERDKEALRELGFPLVTIPETPNTPVRYSVDRDRYYLRDPGLSPDELSALSMAAEVVRFNGLGDKRLYDGIWKLEGSSTRPGRSATDSLGGVDAPAIDAELPADATLAAVFDAIATGRSISFRYRENGRWYLAAYDLDRSDERSFRIDRIDGDVTVAAPPQSAVVPPAPRRASPTRTPWELGTGDPVDALVRIDPAHAPWAERHVGSDAVVSRDPDGTVTLRLHVRGRDAFRSFVLGFLDGAEVTSPPELRAEIIEWLRLKAEQS